MRVRTLIAMAAGIIALSIVGYLALAPRGTPPNRPRRSRRVGSWSPNQGMPQAIIPDANLIGQYVASAVQPRLIANLADQVGDVVVSVRQAYASDRVRNLFDDAQDAGPIGVWQLILQSNVRQGAAASPGAGDVDLYDITATDDHGTTITVTDPTSIIGGSSPLPGGRSHSVFLSAPHPEARIITAIAGSIRRTGGTSANKANRFTIRNVPLPGSPRVFGEITPLRLRHGSTHAHGPAPLYGEDMEIALRGAAPHPDCSDLPYLRLVLPVAVGTDVQSVLPRSARALTIMAMPKGEGHLAVSGTVGTARWRALVWDREPFMLVLSDGATAQKVGVVISLSMSNDSLTLPTARSVFAGDSRTPPGSVAVRFYVRGRPLGPAIVPVTVYRRDGTLWSNGMTTESPIRANGECILSNLPPGIYRLHFHVERIAPLGARGGISIAQYLVDRYQAALGNWNDAADQRVQVVPASRTYGKTVRFVPRAHP